MPLLFSFNEYITLSKWDNLNKNDNTKMEVV